MQHGHDARNTDMTFGNSGITLGNPNELHCEPMDMRDRLDK